MASLGLLGDAGVKGSCEAESKSTAWNDVQVSAKGREAQDV